MTDVGWLRTSYWVGAVVDAVLGVLMLCPSAWTPIYGIARPELGAGFRSAMGLGASLMLGWAVLLLWADRRPVERRGVLLITVLVAFGLALTGFFAVTSGLIALPRMLLTWVLQALLVALFSYSYFRSRAATLPRGEGTTLRMSPADTAWLHMDEPENPADIVLLATFDEPPSYEALKKTVTERLLKYDRFRQRVVETDGHPYWQTDIDFQIENHVLRHALAAPLTEDRLADVVAELGNQPLDPRRPLWALHMVEGSDGALALVFRLHHCIGDGFALTHAMATPAQSADGAPVSDTSDQRAHEEHRPLGERFVHHVEELARDAAHAVDLVKQGADVARSLGHLLLVPFDRETVLKSKPTGRRRMAWSSGMSLDTVKSVARARGATVNDVLMGAMTGALRSFLAEFGEPVDEFSIRAIVPVNLRRAHLVENVDDSMGNRFGLIFLELPIHEQTTHARMRALKERMDTIKRTPEALVAFRILTVLGRAPADWEHLVNDVFGRKASLVVTNVPGPRAPVCFGGKPVREVMFWEPHPAKLGLGVSILSYAGTVIVGVRADECVTDDPRRLVQLFEAEVSTMLQEAS